MNSVVIPLGKSKIGHLDLRFVFRSIEKNLKNYGDIWIVGDKPSWAKNVRVLPHSDDPNPQWKEFNILRKIQAACLVKDITEDFLFTNDDIVLFEEIDATSYPFYHKGLWYDSWVNNRSNYRRTANHTRKWLLDRGFPELNFDTHTPIIYNKQKFLTSFNKVDWNTPWGYGIKSIYCAVNRVEPVFMEDCKLSKKYSLPDVRLKCDGRQLISFTDAPLKAGLRDYLEEKFPNKSIFEK